MLSPLPKTQGREHYEDRDGVPAGLARPATECVSRQKHACGGQRSIELHRVEKLEAPVDIDLRGGSELVTDDPIVPTTYGLPAAQQAAQDRFEDISIAPKIEKQLHTLLELSTYKIS